MSIIFTNFLYNFFYFISSIRFISKINYVKIKVRLFKRGGQIMTEDDNLEIGDGKAAKNLV